MLFHCFNSLNLSFEVFLAKNVQHNCGNFSVECLSTNGHQHNNFILLSLYLLSCTQSRCCCGHIQYIHITSHVFLALPSRYFRRGINECSTLQIGSNNSAACGSLGVSRLHLSLGPLICKFFSPIPTSLLP